MKSILEEYTDSDIEIIKHQINSDEVSIAGIAERCKFGYPTVIFLFPIRKDDNLDYTSITTFLWLTCPYLNKKIHDIESQGYVKKIEKFIEDDRMSISKMTEAHSHYWYLRKNIYRKFVGNVSSLDDNSNIFDSGIGGIKDLTKLKCLHLHYAHYKVCSDNVAGRITEKLLDGDLICPNNICGSYKI